MTSTLSGPLDGEFRWSATLGPDRPAGHAFDRLLDGLVDQVGAAGGGVTQLWIEEVDEDASSRAAAHGFTAYRDLLQMRCPLPAGRSDVPVRPFRADDLDAFLLVNNRAFQWHPEQGGWTRAEVEARQGEPWYDPDGFLVHEAGGRILAFCWTKVHVEHDPPLGEIYVIGVDPDVHGRGLGRALTLAGLTWLHRRGLATGMLYVEGDNVAALRTYERIGFTIHHTNRAFRRAISAGASQ